jgi:DNA-binding NtrC family response regulator
VQRKAGLLGVADGGTVFLDEVGDLPLDAQVMLLRFLQSGELRPVGSTEARRVDVRVIAATHRDLEAAVERGTFREDLYYRLRRVVLEVPPLRARREDIALLVEHFIGRLNGRYGLSVRGVAREALRVLEQHPWRGNVRELEAVLEQAMVFSGEEWIAPGDLELRLPRDVGPTSGSERQGIPATTTGLSWRQREALRIGSERDEVRRQDFIARCRVSREVARRELAGLVRLGLLRRIGFGRGTRYVPLSLWLTSMIEAGDWAITMLCGVVRGSWLLHA